MSAVTEMMTPTDVAAAVIADIKTGVPTRRSIDTRSIVAGESWPTTFASYIPPTLVEGTQFTVARCTATGTPVAVVSEGATKPNALTITTTTVNLRKYAGQATFTYETSLNAAGLEGAVYASLAGQALAALEADIVDNLGAEGVDVPYATGKFVDGILQAQAEVRASGGNPSVIAISAPDAAVLGAAMMPSTAVQNLNGAGVFAGSMVHISPALGAGNALVLDPAAVTLGWHADSPAIISDVFSKSSTNEIVITLDVLAKSVVTVPSLVAAVSVLVEGRK